ncbi:type I-F CRISPR-associated endoribonuclease Cas6/Csy4 [Oceanobacter antarcticus]|uniref:Type I-F CRISPR-associated endoribonuclease Cas6/Csy4 n=1 Tax=Oceanobacter antarcticus TaxID=3133425 RepID=A0ABW8NFY2_9GAMM
MDSYLDIHLLPDPEFEEQQLMNALFSKLHRAIGATSPGQVGISFPGVAKRLGNHLRLHGTAQVLDKLMAQPWLQGMKDYCRISERQMVPSNVRYMAVRRVQAKSAHNKRQRSIRKGWLNAEEALTKIPDSRQRQLTLPYIEMKSLSNGNPMRVYIEHSSLRETPVTGLFNAYGLSATATIPWF